MSAGGQLPNEGFFATNESSGMNPAAITINGWTFKLRTKTPAMFKLVRYFSYTSAIALVVVTIILAMLYRQSAVEDMVRMAEIQNAALARSFANTLWPQFSGYISSVDADGEGIRAKPQTAQIHDALKSLAAGLPVLKVKIYNLDGLTVYSSEPQQIGENKRNNPGFFAAAKTGEYASKLSFRDSFSAFEGTVQQRDLVESYLPITRGDRTVEAVFELYSDVTPLMGRIQRTTNHLALSVLAVFTLLYGVLFLIVVRADRTLKRQYHELESSEEQIKVKNDALVNEITRQKRTEESLRKLSRAVEQSPAMTLITNTEGAIEYVNPRFTEVTGYTLDEVVGKTPRVLKSGETDPRAYKKLWRTIKAGDEWRSELKNRKKNGDCYWASTSISPIKNLAGEVTHFVGISEDITDYKKAQAALHGAKLEAEQANRAKTKFFAAASHDLRQPLHTISLYLPLLAKRITDAKSREIVNAIQLSSDAMGGLLNTLLDISKLDAGVVESNIEPVSIKLLFKRLEQEFTLQAKQKKIELRIVPVERMIYSDATLLERILRNLLTNAIKHTHRGRVLLGLRRQGDGVRLEVWDSGIGIAEHQLESIFQEFYQVGNPERDRNQGLGLGLAIVDRLAQLLGYRIRVKSRPGKGSMFGVEIPASSLETRLDVMAPAPEPQLLRFGGKRVVLIDDDVQVLKVTGMILEEWGCEVIGAESIDTALSKVEANNYQPDLILADFRLRGGKTGLMAIEQINQQVGCEIPAVIITGDTDPGRLREVSDSGYPLLHKPVQAECLYAMMASELGRKDQGEPLQPDAAGN